MDCVLRLQYLKFVHSLQMTNLSNGVGLDDILVRHRQNGIKWTRINEIENNVVMLIRAGFLYDIKRFLGLEGATWIYSLWRGYFERSKPLRNLKSYLEDKGVRYEYLLAYKWPCKT